MEPLIGRALAWEGRLFTVMQENVTGIRVVRAFGRSGFELEKFTAANEENRKKLLKVNRTFAALWATLDLLCGLAFAAVLITGVCLAVAGQLTIGQFTVFISYMYTFFWPIRGFGRILSELTRTLVAVGRLEDIFRAEEETDLDTGSEPGLRGDVDFRDVCFSYGEQPVLDHLNMHIPGGSTVAILGGTGSGKSTLTLLLQRLYEADSGSVRIGGTDVREIRKSHLRSHIGNNEFRMALAVVDGPVNRVRDDCDIIVIEGSCRRINLPGLIDEGKQRTTNNPARLVHYAATGDKAIVARRKSLVT